MMNQTVESSTGAGPLSGLKILDFSLLLPGPYATMMLADMGAEVLRIESPLRPDLVRLAPPFANGVSTAHGMLGRNKRSIALDLKKPPAVEVVKRLVREYDIVLEQFRPGVMDRLGVGYEALKEANPKLIYCCLTGYGQTGPYRDRAGHDNNYLALSGLMSYSGRNAGGPVPQGVQIADVCAGSYNAIVGILAAVINRQRTGSGQMVDVAMTDGAIALSPLETSRALAGGELPEYEKSMLNGGGIYDYYRTSDDRYLSVGSLEPQFFAELARALDHPEWIEKWSPDFEETASFKEDIARIFAGQSLTYWLEKFADYDACVEPVLTIEEMVDHPQVKAREMIIQMPVGDGKTQRQTASPIRFVGLERRTEHIGCQMGEHTRQVLTELGYSENEVQDLKDAGVFGGVI